MSNDYNIQASLNINRVDASQAIKSLQTQLRAAKFSIQAEIQGIRGIAQSAVRQTQQALAGLGGTSTPNVQRVHAVANAQQILTEKTLLANSALSLQARSAAINLRTISSLTGQLVTLSAAYQTLKTGVREYLSYEKQLAGYSQISGQSVIESRKSIGAKVQRESISSGVNRDKLLEGTTTLRQAGLSEGATQQMLPLISQMALNSQIRDMKVASQGIITYKEVWGESSEDISKSISRIITLAKLTSAESEDLISGASRVASAWKEVGGSAPQLESVLAASKNYLQLPIEQISTGLKTISVRLSSMPSVIERLKTLGVDLFPENQFVGPLQALQKLKSLIESMPKGSAERNNLLMTVAGIRQTNILAGVLASLSDAEQLQNSALKSQNVLVNDARIAQQTLGNQLEKTRQSALAFFDSFADNGLGVFSRDVLKLTQNLMEIGTVSKSIAPILLSLSAIGLFKGAGKLGLLQTPDFGKYKPAGLSPVNSSARLDFAKSYHTIARDYSGEQFTRRPQGGIIPGTARAVTSETANILATQHRNQILLNLEARNSTKNIEQLGKTLGSAKNAVSSLGFAVERHFPQATQVIKKGFRGLSAGRIIGGGSAIAMAAGSMMPDSPLQQSLMAGGSSAMILSLVNPWVAAIGGSITALRTFAKASEDASVKMFASRGNAQLSQYNEFADKNSPQAISTLKKAMGEANSGIIDSISNPGVLSTLWRIGTNTAKGKATTWNKTQNELATEQFFGVRNENKDKYMPIVESETNRLASKSKNYEDFTSQEGGYGKNLLIFAKNLGMSEDILRENIQNVIDGRKKESAIIEQTAHSFAFFGNVIGGIGDIARRASDKIPPVIQNPEHYAFSGTSENFNRPGSQKFAHGISELPLDDRQKQLSQSVNTAYSLLPGILSKGGFKEGNFKEDLTMKMSNAGISPTITNQINDVLKNSKWENSCQCGLNRFTRRGVKH